MKKSYIVGTTIAVLATYIASRKIRNEALLGCFKNQVVDDNYTETRSRDEMVYNDSGKAPYRKLKVLKVKNNNSLITINFGCVLK